MSINAGIAAAVLIKKKMDQLEFSTMKPDELEIIFRDSVATELSKA